MTFGARSWDPRPNEGCLNGLPDALPRRRRWPSSLADGGAERGAAESEENAGPLLCPELGGLPYRDPGRAERPRPLQFRLGSPSGRDAQRASGVVGRSQAWEVCLAASRRCSYRTLGCGLLMGHARWERAAVHRFLHCDAGGDPERGVHNAGLDGPERDQHRPQRRGRHRLVLQVSPHRTSRHT